VVFRNLDINYTTTQDFYNTQFITNNKLILEILDMIKNYYNYYYYFQAIVPQPVIYLVFVILNKQQQENTKNLPKSRNNFRDKPNYLYGLKYFYKNY
jgi:hypothetical protein